MGSLNVMPTYKAYFNLNTTLFSFNSAVQYVGGVVATPFAGYLADWLGRRRSITLSCVITIVGAILQGAAQNVAMFIVGRFIIGFGMAIAQTACPIYVAETVPLKHRPFALGLYYACWNLGTILASSTSFGVRNYTSNWQWRIPSLIQVLPGVICMAIVMFLPESPRWLVYQDRHEEALEVLAIVGAQGDTEAPEIQLQYREITDTLAFEKSRNLNLVQSWSTKGNRKRLTLASTFSFIVMCGGSNVMVFYFGSMMSQAGIKDYKTQLKISLSLSCWALSFAIFGSWLAGRVGRKPLCVVSLGGQTVFLFIFGGLVGKFGTSNNNSGIYAAIAMLFLFQAIHVIGVTPLTVLYPPEILSYEIRASGMALYTFTTKALGLVTVMVWPFSFKGIGWKTFMWNGGLNILMVIGVILYWVETKGLTLEEIDELFDGVKHSDVPNLKEVSGKDNEILISTEMIKDASKHDGQAR
ncbi:hypothetical protein LTR84_000241 [Exophiala bonariae]|uniref:Major facilitator superfamily (MFS) profile domain-containing protein n=1 Tax=Exophiala bonariae TaxID=1690606 RepID=A0AAV9NQD6_9EURO|nr:hypothetical protein LTR84_000241 [Exophiala bonariae]